MFIKNMKLMIHIVQLLTIIISTQFLSCEHPTTPPPEIGNFYVKIIVKDSSGQSKTGLMVSGGNLISYKTASSEDFVATDVFKLRFTASDSHTIAILFRDSTFTVRAVTNMAAAFLGYTSSKGIFESKDPLRFPSIFNNRSFNSRDEFDNNLGNFELFDNAKFILTDTSTNDTQIVYHKIQKGMNQLEVVWNPTHPKITQSTSHSTQIIADYPDSIYNKITISDAASPIRHHQTLYMVREDKGIRKEMPPPAPDFDARFVSNMYVETYPVILNPAQTYKYPISVQTINYPLTISWKFKCPPNFTLSAMLDGKEESRQLICDSNTIVITNSDITRLVVGIHNPSLPALWALHQNYPNPFDELATIKFDLPYESFVELKVFNLSGQVIKTLVNERMPAGFHKILWDASK